MDANQDQDNSQAIDVKVASVEPVEAPVEESTSESPQSIVPPVEAAGDAPAQPENPAPSETQTSHEQQNAPAPHHAKSGAPVLAIFAAIVVAIGLAGITVYAYIQSQDKTAKTPETTETTTTTPSVTSEDVDTAEGDVDEALKSTEEADFPETELTDQSLGL